MHVRLIDVSIASSLKTYVLSNILNLTHSQLEELNAHMLPQDLSANTLIEATKLLQVSSDLILGLDTRPVEVAFPLRLYTLEQASAYSQTSPESIIEHASQGYFRSIGNDPDLLVEITSFWGWFNNYSECPNN